MASRISRRDFLRVAVVAGAAGGGLLVGCTVAPSPAPTAAPTSAPQPTAAPQPTSAPAIDLPRGSLEPGVWLRVDPDETVTVTVHRSEMGQGVQTSLAMLVAEDLGADWSKIRVAQADADGRYGNQLTGGSTSVEQSYVLLRKAGMAARMMLTAAAAAALGVDAGELTAAGGAVTHAASGRSLSYGQLAGAAAALPVPEARELKLPPPGAFQIIGTPRPRLDAPAKVDGSAVYGIDVRLPGMRYAVIARSPDIGGTVASYDEAAALAVPGVLAVLPIEGAIAVVAEHSWAAIRGRDALKAEWAPGERAGVDSAAVFAGLAAAAEGPLARVIGGAPAEGAAQTVEATYELPYQAHSPLEPTNCTADVRADRAAIWAPTQDPQTARLIASGAAGLPSDAVTLHVTLLGGGFGRRLRTDDVAEATAISKAIGAPVQLLYTREDELRHSFYRPASHHRLRAELGADGAVLSWRHGFASHWSAGDVRFGTRPPYRLPSRAEGAITPGPLRVGPWRGVDLSQNVFVIEAFFDEVAEAAGRDPLELRRELIEDERLRAVLDAAAERAGWAEPLPAGRGRGVAVCAYNSTLVAQIAEVTVAGGRVTVDRVVCAVDCGLPVNPSGVEAQVESAVAWSLTATLKGAITIAGGAVEQANFDGYPLLRHDEMPQVEVVIVSSGVVPYGMGEPPVPALPAAVLNAIFAASGRRLRRLPVRPADLA